MRWATLDPDGRPTGFYDPDVHPALFEQTDGEPRPKGPIAGAGPVTEADWQELLSHPGLRKLEGGRVVATEPPALLPDAQAAADRALLREATRPSSSTGPPAAGRARSALDAADSLESRMGSWRSGASSRRSRSWMTRARVKR